MEPIGEEVPDGADMLVGQMNGFLPGASSRCPSIKVALLGIPSKAKITNKFDPEAISAYSRIGSLK